MKRLLYWMLCVALLAGCGSDSDELTDPNVTLEISTLDLLFEGDGGTQEFTVTSSGSWKVSSSVEWCKTNFSAGNGNFTLAVTTEGYIGLVDDRVAVVTVQAGIKTRELKVTQKPIKEIRFEQDTIYVAAKEESISVEMKNYVDGVEYQISTSDWISQASKGKSIVSKTFDFIVMNTLWTRTGYIVFSVGSLTDTVWVVQEAKDFTEKISNVELEMVYVKGGTFSMGATEEQGDDAYNDEKPVHSETLSDYYIGKFEVTQGLWEKVMGTTIEEQLPKLPEYMDGKLYGVGSDYPMYYVNTTVDAWNFCRKLSQLTGKNYTLPTEAQWEYAARGGVKSQGYKYSGSDDIGEVAWYDDNAGGINHLVGTKKSNELGIYDMSGNVYELCRDRYGDTSNIYMIRGGSRASYARDCRVSSRNRSCDVCRYANVGFRVVLLP